MAEPDVRQTTAHAAGTVTVRQRPAVLLMKVRLRAAEPTLELGLAKLKGQREAAAKWLTRLGAVRVEVGEPHFADQADKDDPMAAMRAATAHALRGRPAAARAEKQDRGVAAVLTAEWDIATMSAEETLALVDRLRFEATADAAPAEPAEELPPWAGPEEQVREMLAQMHQPPADDGAPQFLFVARLGEDARAKAAAEAFARARENAERLARAAGLRLGRLSTLLSTPGGVGDFTRPDKVLSRQRCGALLAGTTYDLREDEAVSDDPRSAEFSLTVNVTYALE